MPTREELEAEFLKATKGVELWQAHVQEIGMKLGLEVSNTLRDKHRREDESVTLWERSTPAERAQLSRDEPEAFAKMLADYQAAGDRKLFGGR